MQTHLYIAVSLGHLPMLLTPTSKPSFAAPPWVFLSYLHLEEELAAMEVEVEVRK
jgi:hypothetical protein